jgi:hypothetical protein
LTLSAIKKILEAVGGSLSITEHHDLKDEAHSIHVIALSIPCRQYTYTVGLGTMDDDRDDGGVLFNARGSVINARDAAKTSRQMIDFGMDTPSDSLFERTVEVCNLFGVQIKILPELTVNVNLNLYRVIFACSAVRCSELRDLGYKGKLVLVSTITSTISTELETDFSQRNLCKIFRFPYRLDDWVQFFRSISQQHTFSIQPRNLTIFDRVQFSLQPHEHIPFVLWTKEALRFLSSVQVPEIPFDYMVLSGQSPSSVTVPEKFPPTSAYTPIAAAETCGPPEDADFEYLMNTKIYVSSLSHVSVRIADNHVDESNLNPLPITLLGNCFIYFVCYILHSWRINFINFFLMFQYS